MYAYEPTATENPGVRVLAVPDTDRPCPQSPRYVVNDVESAGEFNEEDARIGRRSWFMKLTLVAVLVATVTLVVTWHASTASTSDPEARSNQFWTFIPAPGHYDQQGNFVADTWDHFVLPNCDSGAVPGHMITKFFFNPTGHRFARRVWVPPYQTPAQAACAARKAMADQVHKEQIKDHWTFVHLRDEIRDLHRWQADHSCGVQQVNVDFKTTHEWTDEAGKPSGAHCQKACTESQQGCDGFSWISPWGCYLKKFNSSLETEFATAHKTGVYSGYPCSPEGTESLWIKKKESKYDLPTPPDPRPAPSTSMLCLQLLLPFENETNLVIMQYHQGLSIFQCERYAVYSSELLSLADGLTTRKIYSSQMAEIGGQWATALNTEVFMAFWRAVILDGDYLKANWVVKVDPDTVWFPHRLRPILEKQELDADAVQGRGVYLNNCREGMHGPIEVFSQNAIATLANSSAQCYKDMTDWGDTQWGEDMWIDQCFLKVGKAKRVYVESLLAEDHCNKWPGWKSCTARDKVAFHPFKDVAEYRTCAEKAVAPANSTVELPVSSTVDPWMVQK